MQKVVNKVKKGLSGEVFIPADKSISHRAVMFSSLAKGISVIKNFSSCADCLSTLSLFKNLGVEYEYVDETTLKIISGGKLLSSDKELDCGNSGTTMRLVSGILAGQNFSSTLMGDESLSKRPMKRIIEPLTLMGAEIESNYYRAPLVIKGKELCGIDYKTPIPSAQVKSSIILAGLHAEGKTRVCEEFLSRNHTEKMLEYLNAKIYCDKNCVTVEKSELEAKTIEVPGDISSAAYFIAAGVLVEGSDIILKNVGLNPTRVGILAVVEKMGAQVEILDKRVVSNEEVGDIRIKSSSLKGCEISGDLIPRLIDEIPVIAVIAAFANGTTIIKDAQDLRNKESDRIFATVNELRKIGVNISETGDGMIIEGQKTLKGDAEVETYHDHRLAMSLYVAGMMCEKPISINGFEWVNISFPTFENLMTKLL